jgi:tetratricopeptide (TPR) repeat protein
LQEIDGERFIVELRENFIPTAFSWYLLKTLRFDLLKNKNASILMVVGVAVLVSCTGTWIWSEVNKKAIDDCCGRATNFQYKGQLRRALKELDKLPALGVDAALYHEYRGSMQHWWGYLHQADREYKKSLKTKPENSVVWSNEADLLYRLDDVDGSLQACNLALKYNPRESVALSNRAQIWLRKKEYQRALEDASNALVNLTGKDWSTASLKKSVLVERADAYRHLGKAEESEHDLSDIRRNAICTHKAQDSTIAFEKAFSRKNVRANFILCSNLPEVNAAALTDFFERFLIYIDRNVCPVKADPKFHIFIFDSRSQYDSFLKVTGENRSLYGHYSYNDNALYTSVDAGAGTFAHELMHKVIEDLPFIDAWAQEGVPTIFEKFYGYPFGDSYKLTLGLQNPWRIKELGKSLTGISLPEIIAQQNPAFSESEARLAAIFLFKSAKLRKYLELCANGHVGDYPTVFESAFDKTAVQMQPEWKQYLAKIDSERADIDTLPTSFIFSDKKHFDDFVSLHKSQLSPE